MPVKQVLDVLAAAEKNKGLGKNKFSNSESTTHLPVDLVVFFVCVLIFRSLKVKTLLE